MNDAELSLWQYREIASDWRPFSMTNFVIPDFLQREIEYRGKGGGETRPASSLPWTVRDSPLRSVVVHFL